MKSKSGLIKNKSELCSSKICSDLLDILEYAVNTVIPYYQTKNLIKSTPEFLIVGNENFKLDEIGKIYVVGAGKASYPIALSLNEILGNKINKGIVAVKEGTKERLPNIEIIESAHPIPDIRSINIAKKIGQILDSAEENDIVFAAITGGASALITDLPDEITLNGLQNINNALLMCGCPISEINTVRRHLCKLKGGLMVKRAQPARLITLTLNTGGGKIPWPDMCIPDTTTFQDAIDVLKNNDLWEKIDESVKDYFLKNIGNTDAETVKSFSGMKENIYYLVKPRQAIEAAAKKAKELGYEPHILSCHIEGEAKDVGIVLADITNEIAKYNRPFHTPCALISGGETTVSFQDKNQWGLGGPNQETVLGFSTAIEETSNCVFASIDTDGTDGPCEFAGGIIDQHFSQQAAEAGYSVKAHLANHDSGTLLNKMNNIITTGNTGTNVMNLRVVLITENK